MILCVCDDRETCVNRLSCIIYFIFADHRRRGNLDSISTRFFSFFLPSLFAFLTRSSVFFPPSDVHFTYYSLSIPRHNIFHTHSRRDPVLCRRKPPVISALFLTGARTVIVSVDASYAHTRKNDRPGNETMTSDE